MAAGDSGKDPDTPTEPAWISIARQKQRGMHQEKELDREKLVSPDNESNTEKQNKGKEQTEVLAVQICDAFVSPPVVFFGSAAMLPYHNDYRYLMSVTVTEKNAVLINVLQIQSFLIVQICNFVSPRNQNPGTMWSV